MISLPSFQDFGERTESPNMLSITYVRNRARNSLAVGIYGVIKRYLSSNAKVIMISKSNENNNNEQGQDYTKDVKWVGK